MTERFRDCFVGEKGYDALKRLMRISNEFSQDVSRCLQDRHEAELAYIKALRKTSDTLNRLSGKMKGSINTALDNMAVQTEKECDIHMLIANTLWNQIANPLKNLADNQAKDRKAVDDSLNGKLKALKDKKDYDTKCRTKQFKKSREIETYYMKIADGGKFSRNSARDSNKEGTHSTPLVMSCVMPSGRYTNANEKSTATNDVKFQSNMESMIQKAEEDLEKTERKYHEATKNVEIARQAWDGELCRSCDQIERMEQTRLREMEKYIQIYNRMMQTAANSMQQIAHDLQMVQVSPNDDLIIQARSNVETSEIELLLYDIYAENESNPMSEQRRILSLLRWKEWLQRDIEVYRKMKDNEIRASSMAQSFTDSVIQSSQDEIDEESSSTDEDGAVSHRRNRKTKANNKTDRKKDVTMDQLVVTRQSTYLFRCLFEGSLYKMDKILARLKKLPDPHYEYSEKFAKSFTAEGYPLTFLRIPTQLCTQTPPSAPPNVAARSFVQTMPVFVPVVLQQAPMAYPMPTAAYADVTRQINDMRFESSAPVRCQRFVAPPQARRHQQLTTAAPPYPVLSPPVQQNSAIKMVRAIHDYTAERDDELTIRKNDIIAVLEERGDGWYRGILDDKEGLFPGNHTKKF